MSRVPPSEQGPDAGTLLADKRASPPPPSHEPEMTTVQRIGEVIADNVERWMPNPFLFAILLTYVAGVAAFFLQGSSPTEVALAWYGGFWTLLQFAMQMVIILVTASVVAYHPRVKGLILRIVELPKTGPQATVLVGVGAMLAGWFSWGLGLIFGAILAREMGKQCAKRGIAIHYPLMAVAGYMGMGLTWGWGLSNSAGLLQATDGNIIMQQGIVDRVIPATEWVFHSYPITLFFLFLVIASVLLYLLTPPAANCRGITHYLTPAELGTEEAAAEVVATEKRKPTPAERMDNSMILGGIIALVGVILFVRAFITQGLGALDLNTLNFGFLMVGMILFTNPTKYMGEFNAAVAGSAGVILQFPFYAGIVGIMAGTGLVTTIAAWLLSIATTETFPVISWITAGIMNVFVPSAGGEWAILGGPLMTASQELGVPLGHTIATYAAGDAHTNLINPFWALPLLAITGLRAREMFGYAITMMILLTPFLAVAFYFLPY